MQTVSQATEDLTYITGLERPRVTQIARALIDAGILPKSSGRNIKKLSAEQLLPFLAAVAMADKVVDAPHVARSFANLSLPPDTDAKVGSLELKKGLPQVFASIIEQREIWRRVTVTLSRQQSGFTTEIEGELVVDGTSYEISLNFWREPSWGHFCKTSFTVSAEGIENLRNLFVREDVE